MNYRGYTATVQFDSEERTLRGKVEGVRDVITFEAEDVVSLEREFRVSVDEYIRFCEENGRSPERPFSGRVLVRMDASLHKEIARAAETAEESMNRWIVGVLRAAVDDRRPGMRERPLTPVAERLLGSAADGGDVEDYHRYVVEKYGR
jgi:predicted HicB family RNase H-like nuclease